MLQTSLMGCPPLTLTERQAAAARIVISHARCSDHWIAGITGLVQLPDRGFGSSPVDRENSAWIPTRRDQLPRSDWHRHDDNGRQILGRINDSDIRYSILPQLASADPWDEAVAMIVLGAKGGEHDACFALVKDGEPLFVYEVERFNRVKHGMSSDPAVLFQGLADYGIARGDVDMVANCGDTSLMPERLQQISGYLSGPAFARAAKNVEWRHPTFHRILVAAGFSEDRVVGVRHHLCHVASVFYASSFDDAAVLSLDGSGEADTAMLAHCSRRDGINILRTIGMPHSLGRFYEAATHWLGWGFGEEGKTMALAGYGDSKRYIADLSDVFRIDADGFFEFDTRLTDGCFSYSTDELVGQVFEELFGPRRKRVDDLEQRHMDVAAATQHLCERAMVRLAVTLKKQTGSNALLLAGGVASNSVSNGAIRSQGIFQQVVAFPQVTDAGTALGAALYVYHQKQTRPHRRWQMRHPFLGRQLDLAQVHEAAARIGIEGSQCSDPAAFAAGSRQDR